MEQQKQHRPKGGGRQLHHTTRRFGDNHFTLPYFTFPYLPLPSLTSPHLSFLYFSTLLSLTLFTLLRLSMISFELLSRIGFSISSHFSKSKRHNHPKEDDGDPKGGGGRKQHHPKGRKTKQHHTRESNTPTKKDGTPAQRERGSQDNCTTHKERGDRHSALLYFTLLTVI